MDTTTTTTLSFPAESSRPLATIVKVKRLLPIANADRILLAEVKGWRCVVKREEFQEGDLAIYISIDSIVDGSDPTFAFLNGKTRIKTVKLRGVVSQGLLGPIDWLTSRGVDGTNLTEGDDVTTLLGVTKYVPKEEVDQYQYYPAVNGRCLKPFPEFVPKTHESRLQDDGLCLDSIKGREIVITRKEDGCSCSFIWNNGDFFICGRRFIWEAPDACNSHYFQIQDAFDVENKMKSLGRNIALQGEIVGGKINSNRLKLKERDFRVFNVYDINNQSYLGWKDVLEICEHLGMYSVAVVYQGPADDLELSTDAFLELASKQTYAKGELAEGIVVKTDDRCDDNGDGDDHHYHHRRVSFKVISNEYLLKHERD